VTLQLERGIYSARNLNTRSGGINSALHFTALRWRLEKDGRTLEILEISAKAKADTEEQAQALAKQFFGAAKAAGLGEPSGRTKTKQVLEFFKPGR
jgi:hypothetical protein